MNATQKKALATIAVIVLAVGLLYGLRWFVDRFPPSAQEPEQVVTETPAAQAETDPAPGSGAQTRLAGRNTSGLTYEQALAMYKNRIQFDDCRGIREPVNAGGSMVVKQGSKIMLDNRDPVPHTIAFKGVSVRIAAYDFAIVTANTLGIYNVTCDGGGAASLNVEK